MVLAVPVLSVRRGISLPMETASTKIRIALDRIQMASVLPVTMGIFLLPINVWSLTPTASNTILFHSTATKVLLILQFLTFLVIVELLTLILLIRLTLPVVMLQLQILLVGLIRAASLETVLFFNSPTLD